MSALDELCALVQVPGALKIITNMDDPDGAEYSEKDPRHYILHDVVRIEGPDAEGKVTAYTAPYNAQDHGYDDRMTHDECTGQPEALLARLWEWRRDGITIPQALENGQVDVEPVVEPGIWTKIGRWIAGE